MVLLFLILVFLGLASRLMAQDVVTNQLEAIYENQDILIADFANGMPQAEKLPAFINSTFREVGAIVSPDGQTLFFGRQNFPENTGGVQDYEDIWYSKWNNLTGDWSVPEQMGEPINSVGPNSVNFVSVTGDTIILGNKYRKNKAMTAGLSVSIRENGHWSYPRAYPNLCRYNMSDRFSMSLSYNKEIMITSQELEDSYGQRDLYVTLIHPNGAVTTLNLGRTVNTPVEESSPFLAPDYKTLYFASKGHNGFGGFDIYVTHRLDDTWQNWSEPENLGSGINSEGNEEYFNFTFDGLYAYFTKEISAENTDIYRVELSKLYNASGQLASTQIGDMGLGDKSYINEMGLSDLKVKQKSGSLRYANLEQ